MENFSWVFPAFHGHIFRKEGSVHNTCTLTETLLIHCDTLNVMKCILISPGCDRGFGQTLATKLALDGFRVYAGCLDGNSDGARQLQALSKVTVVPVDVTSDKSVEEAIRKLNSDLWDTGKRPSS